MIVSQTKWFSSLFFCWVWLLPLQASAMAGAVERAPLPQEGSGAVRAHRGLPQLFIDGQPHNGMTFTTYDQVRKEYQEFADTGVDLFSFVISPTGCAYHNIQRKPENFDLWIAPDQFDFANFDERIDRVLRADPDAKIFPRLSLSAPLWWIRENSGEMGLGTDKDGKTVRLGDGGRQGPSWASEKWRQDTLMAIRRLLEHVEASDYADNIVGWHLVSGSTEEWMIWGSNNGQWGDISEPSQARFRKWLRPRYQTDAALQSAWHDSSVTLGTAQIASRAQREQTTLGSLRDPAKEQAAIDSLLYFSDLVYETIDLFCGAIRTQTKGQKMIGVFYGYILQFDGETRLQNAGHLALGKLLRSPNVDFLSAPSSYKYRGYGGSGTPHYMAPHGSVKLHGKLWFNENDLRNSITPRMPGMTEAKYRRWGAAADIQGDIVQQEKELAHSMTSGAAQWWFDVGLIEHSDPTLLARYADFVRQADEVLEKQRGPVDEVAFVVDDKSSVYFRIGEPFTAALVTNTFPALHRIGAPVSHYLLNDLPALADHKLLIFANTLAPSAAERAALEALKGEQRVLLFQYGAGVYDEGTLSLDAMQTFTGIQMKVVNEPMEMVLTLEDNAALPKSLRGQRITAYTNNNQNKVCSVSPVLVADDPQATVLGRLPDGSPGLVVKAFDDWVAVYSAVPINNRDLLRWLAERAGVHLYIDTPDLLWANQEMVSICVDEAGPRTIRLPQSAAVKELYSGQQLSPSGDSVTIDFEANATQVLLLTPTE